MKIVTKVTDAGVADSVVLEEFPLRWKQGEEPPPPTKEELKEEFKAPQPSETSEVRARRLTVMMYKMWRATKMLGRAAKLAPKVGYDYSLGMVVSSMQPIPRSDIKAGIVTKLPPFAMNVAIASVNFGWSQFLIESFAMSAALDYMHGVGMSWWMNFQDELRKKYGKWWQTGFNFAYGQAIGVYFRNITYRAYLADPWPLREGELAPTPGLSFDFLSISVGTALFGSLSDVYSKNGLTSMLSDGAISYQARTRIQQVRDMAYMLQQSALYFNFTKMFWGLYALDRVLDATTHYISKRVGQKPILYIAANDVEAWKTLENMFARTASTAPQPKRAGVAVSRGG